MGTDAGIMRGAVQLPEGRPANGMGELAATAAVVFF